MYRKLKKLHYKVNNAKLDLEFLGKCKAYTIIPKFLYFKLHNQNIRNSKTYQSCQFKLLNFEINNKNCLLKQHVIEFDQAYFNFRNTVSYLDFSSLYSRLKRSNVSKLKHDETAHEKKLEALGIPINITVTSDKTVINLSNRTLTTSELDSDFLTLFLNLKLIL